MKSELTTAICLLALLVMLVAYGCEHKKREALERSCSDHALCIETCKGAVEQINYGTCICESK